MSVPSRQQPSEPHFVRYPGPPTPFTEAAEAWQRRVEEHMRQVAAERSTDLPRRLMSGQVLRQPTSHSRHQTQSPAEHTAFLAEPDPVGLYAEPLPAAAPVKMSDTKSAKRLRLVSLIVLGLTLSGLGVAQALGVAIPLASYLAAALLVIGVTLVVATWLGKARGLLPVGAVLAVAVLIVTAAGPALEVPVVATTAARTQRWPSSRPPATRRTSASFRSISASLRSRQTPATQRISILAGSRSQCPKTPMWLSTTAPIWERFARTANEVQAGSELTGQITDPQPAQPGQPTLTLNLSVDAGNIQVQR